MDFFPVSTPIYALRARVCIFPLPLDLPLPTVDDAPAPRDACIPLVRTAVYIHHPAAIGLAASMLPVFFAAPPRPTVGY